MKAFANWFDARTAVKTPSTPYTSHSLARTFQTQEPVASGAACIKLSHQLLLRGTGTSTGYV